MSGSEFILILVILYGHHGAPAATSILFPSEQACEAAKKLAVAEFSFQYKPPARALCVPRNTP